MDILRNKIVIVAAADPALRDSVAEDLRGFCGQVLSVPGAIEAYELVRERPVDAVVTSARLSSGDPVQLLSDLRHLNFDIPVVVFGAAGEKLSQTESLHRGFSAYFLQSGPSVAFREALARSLQFVEERKKRKVERVAVAAEVELRFGDPAVNFRAPVLNLSRGGMFLSIDKNFPPPQSVVAFRLTLPVLEQHPELEGKALVRWVRERPGGGHLPGVGVEFTELSEQTRTFLDAYIARNSHRR